MSTYNAVRHRTPARTPEVEEMKLDPLDDALWHLQREVERITGLVNRHGLSPEQRRELTHLLVKLSAAVEWRDPPQRGKTASETEPAL